MRGRVAAGLAGGPLAQTAPTAGGWDPDVSLGSRGHKGHWPGGSAS